MDFQLSEEQVLLRDTTRDLLARAYDTERRLEIIDSDPGFSRDVWKQLAEIGILGLGFEEEAGGQNEIQVVLTEVGRRLAPEPVLHGALGPGALIAELGSARAARASRRGRRRRTPAGLRPPGAGDARDARTGDDQGCPRR